MSNTKKNLLLITLLIGTGILLNTNGIQAQTPQGTKVSPTKTAKINFKEVEKSSAAVPADSLKRKKVENQNQIIPEIPLPRGARIIKHNPPLEKRDTSKFEIQKKEKGGNDGFQPNFPGLGDNNTSIPPDIGAAAGPNHLMVALNTEVRIQNKTGTNLSTVTLNAFFAPLGGAPNMFDPKVLYDPFAQRWIITAPANSPVSFGAPALLSSIMIGVSDTNDPTGTWALYQFDADATDLNWFDYPSIGFNKNWIVVTGNLFSVSAWAFQGVQLYIFDKAALYGGTATPTMIDRPIADGFTICPAVTLDNTQNTEYLVSSASSTAGTLRLYTITGTPAAPVYTATLLFPAASSGWSANPPGGNDFAPQSGAPQLINNGDRRIQNAVFRNGSLWCTHTIFLPTGGSPTRSSIQWWQIDPTTGTVQQNARIDDLSGGNFFAYPSIAVNAYNDALIGYTSFSSTQFASCNYSFRLHTHPLNFFPNTVQYRTGSAKYFKTFGGSQNRWGDYSSTCIDPDDFSIWTIQEYADFPSGGFDRWGTEWNNAMPPVSELYAKDRNDDLGAEPNTSTLPMWESPDIWVRNLADAGLAHQNAEYRTGTSNPNFVYVQVRNRGSVPSTGTEQITLYWAKAGSYLGWLDPWNGGIYFDPGQNTMLMGDVIGTQTIPAIAANSSTILPPFAWNPTDPSLYAAAFGTQQNHYCLLARITTNVASPFGMTFPETTALYDNVQKNNNVVWKNIGVYDVLPGVMAPAEAVVGNMSKVPMKAKFKFELIDQDGNLGLFDKGMIKVTPTGKLKEALRQNPAKGEGIKQNADGTLLITQQGAELEGITLNPQDFGVFKIEYVPSIKNDKMKGFAIRFTQMAEEDSTQRVIGGQTFVYGQVAGYQTEPRGGGGFWECWWWWILLIAIVVGVIIWIWKKKN